MDHVKALGIKFIAIAVTIFSIFGIFYDATLINLFWISLLVTGISYLIGDMFILRRFGNITASISDLGLSFLLLWGLGNLFIENGMPIVYASLLTAFFITCCEPFIHGYIVENFSDPPEPHERAHTPNILQTEFGKDTTTDKNDDK